MLHYITCCSSRFGQELGVVVRVSTSLVGQFGTRCTSNSMSPLALQQLAVGAASSAATCCGGPTECESRLRQCISDEQPPGQ
jgi:hypothetical protein